MLISRYLQQSCILGKTSEQGECSRCMVEFAKSGFTMKTHRNLCLVQCACKTHCLPMFRVNRQIPRCVLTWVFGHHSLCYNMFYEPCDGFRDLLSVLLVFFATLWFTF